MTEEDQRRLVLIDLDAQVLMDGFGLRGPVMVDSDLPRDMELVGVEYQFQSHRILLKLRHQSFEPVQPGTPIPFVNPVEFEGIHIHGEGSERWMMTNSNSE